MANLCHKIIEDYKIIARKKDRCFEVRRTYFLKAIVYRKKSLHQSADIINKTVK